MSLYYDIVDVVMLESCVALRLTDMGNNVVTWVYYFVPY